MTSVTNDPEEQPARPYIATAATVLLVLAMLAAWQMMTRRDAAQTARRVTEEDGGTVAVSRREPAGATGRAAVSPPGAVAATARTGRDREPLTVYLVGSQEQARQTWFALNEANVVRASSGEPAVNGTVLLIGSDEEARFMSTLGASDAIRDALGLPPIVVVDLRTP